ncbi:OLC1v1009898C2 [Oldenlandia corymbosa var. corymbosa]|uniref:OLC1v1009898C2 n=1 Tax=Oldenlandia corymbosa var. corymbosa TaxID=529605 RepID=A0AAV1DQJ8_OLDCO|nr:OLC1v1009898C2 [Oldenlandia corymbosa var. corymbosa]
MSMGSSSAAGDVSIPRGGPIFLQNAVGSLTKVPDFEHSVYDELESLKEEIGWDSTEICLDEISVDDLKIIKEEELVSRAFEEAFKDGESIQKDLEILKDGTSPDTPQPSTDRLLNENDTLVPFGSSTCAERLQGESNDVVSYEPSGDGVPENSESKKTTAGKKKKKQNKIRQKKNVDLEEGYVAKVRELATIKQKQDEDKKAARLHSFDGSSKNPPATCFRNKRQKQTTASVKSLSCSAHARASYSSEHVSIHFPEVILCIEVYHNKRSWTKSQEFLVLGQQFLSEIKDKIYCLTDEIMKKEGVEDSSGYFLIEDVFCNDTREPSAIDYSKPIFEWLEQSENEALDKWEYIVSGEQQLQQKRKAFLDNSDTVPLPQFKAVDMQKIRICDISFRIGAGYLYCHRGDCKHIIVFRDMRLSHPEDVQNRAAYPLISYQLKLILRKCSVCNIYKATKITVDDKWAKENPCYFCDLCYYMLHYVDGSLLYSDFSVYDYFHE